MVTHSLQRQNYVENLNLKNVDNSDLTFAKPILEELNIQNPTKKFFEKNEEEAKQRKELVKFKNSVNPLTKIEEIEEEKKGLSALFNKVANFYDLKSPRKEPYQRDEVKIKPIEK